MGSKKLNRGFRQKGAQINQTLQHKNLPDGGRIIMRRNTYISGLIRALCILSSAPVFAKNNPKIDISLQTVTNINALSNPASNNLHSRAITTAESYFKIGYQLLQIRDYQGAINNFNLALAISPKLTKIYYYRGLARYQLGEIKGAKKDFVLSPVDYIPNTS